jgi:hypothetical protein
MGHLLIRNFIHDCEANSIETSAGGMQQWTEAGCKDCNPVVKEGDRLGHYQRLG